MKKLYFLNEEEKERILNLHKERTKKQYLNELDVISNYSPNPITQWGNVVKDITRGLNSEQSKGGGAIPQPTEDITMPDPGTWTGVAQRSFMLLINQYSSGKNRWRWRNMVTKWCSDNIYNRNLGPNSIPKSQLQTIVNDTGRALKLGTYTMGTLTNRGVTNETVTEFVNQMGFLVNIPNFCHANNDFKSFEHASGGENLMEMYDEISNNQVFITNIIGGLKNLAEQTKIFDYTKKKEEDENKTKTDFADCIKKQPNRFTDVKKNIKLGTNVSVEIGGKIRPISAYFFNDGRYVLVTDKDKFKKTSKPSGTWICEEDPFSNDTKLVLTPYEDETTPTPTPVPPIPVPKPKSKLNECGYLVLGGYSNQIRTAMGKTTSSTTLTPQELVDVWNKIKS